MTRAIHYLGPPGTFSERAARLAADGEPVAEPNFAAVARVAAGGSLGLLPYYNLLEGLVQESIDLIHAHDLRVRSAVRLPVRFAAGSVDGTLDHDVVHSHPKALGQCGDYLAAELPHARQEPAPSTAEAARRAADGSGVALAAEAALLAAGLTVIARDVGDRPDGRVNFTDFLVVAAEDGPSINGPARSLLAITPSDEHPGLLAALLQQVAYHDLNIAKIHSRPGRGSPASDGLEPQRFFLELTRPADDPAVTRCVEAIEYRYGRSRPATRLLGSWPELPPPRPEVPLAGFEVLDPCVVIGAAGGIGRLLTAQLNAAGVRVRGVDPAGEPAGLQFESFHSADTPAGVLDGARWVVLAVPERAALAWLPALDALPAGVLVSDVLSAKAKFAEAAAERDRAWAWSGLHPMFAPSVGLACQNVALVTPGPDETYSPSETAVSDLIERGGGRVIRLSLSAHERFTSRLQVATHALLMTLARVFADGPVPAEVALELATPINRTLFAVLCRMAHADPATYAHIQHSNAFAAEARAAVADAAAGVREEPDVEAVMAACRAYFADHEAELLALSKQIAALTLDARP